MNGNKLVPHPAIVQTPCGFTSSTGYSLCLVANKACFSEHQKVNAAHVKRREEKVLMRLCGRTNIDAAEKGLSNQYNTNTLDNSSPSIDIGCRVQHSGGSNLDVQLLIVAFVRKSQV